MNATFVFLKCGCNCLASGFKFTSASGVFAHAGVYVCVIARFLHEGKTFVKKICEYRKTSTVDWRKPTSSVTNVKSVR